ncbi:MAG: glucosaminidase domain-containing protein [Bacteroidota bacterium]
MRLVCTFLLFSALLASSCKFLPLSSSKSKGGADIKPATYSATGNAQSDYIQLYSDAAKTEMERGGVPASIVLAQGLLESSAGQSEVAKEANNHFGIKCGSDWNGKSYYKKDDDYDKNGQLKESCFRKYSSVDESFLDHGQFLHDPKKHNRYGFLFNLDQTDYKGWARGLQSAGYATSPTYADQLIDLIERYRLYEYDKPGKVIQPGAPPSTQTPVVKSSDGKPEVAPLNSRIGRVNDVKVVLTKDGEALEDVARGYHLNPDKVVSYNDRGYPPGVRLRPGTRVYIQPKKDKWRGRDADHYVREGQTMFDISQQYGVKLDKLRERNGLQQGQEPAVGEKIKIKGTRKNGDIVKLRDISKEPIKPNVPVVISPTTGTQKDKMTPSDDLDFEISTDKDKTDKPATDKPVQPSGKPSTTGSDYPKDDPNPQPATGWQPPVTPPVDTTPEQPEVKPGYHLVVKGDTLYSISKKYNTTVARLKQMNKLTDDGIKIGQQLKIQ